MASSTEGLREGIDDLRRRAAAVLTGNDYYLVVHKLEELADIVAPKMADAEAATPPAGGGWAAALAAVRGCLGAEVAGDRYYRAAQTLDDLSALPARCGNHAGAVVDSPPATGLGAALDGLARQAALFHGNGYYLATTAIATLREALPAAPRPSFDDLAAASRRRVEAMAGKPPSSTPGAPAS